MPDKYLSIFVELGLVKLIIDDLQNYSRADTRSKLCRVLAFLACHRDCKAYIL